MKKVACLMLTVLLIAVAAAQGLAIEEPTRPRAGQYLGQTCGGCAGGLLLAAGGALAVGGSVGLMAEAGFVDEFVPGSASLEWAPLGVLVACPLGCAMGTAMVGSWQYRRGSAGLAYAGAYAPVVLVAVAALVAEVVRPDGVSAEGYSLRHPRPRSCSRPLAQSSATTWAPRTRSAPALLRPRWPTAHGLARSGRDTPPSIAGW